MFYTILSWAVRRASYPEEVVCVGWEGYWGTAKDSEAGGAYAAILDKRLRSKKDSVL